MSFCPPTATVKLCTDPLTGGGKAPLVEWSVMPTFVEFKLIFSRHLLCCWAALKTPMVFSRCQTNTLCTMAPPQKTIPTPIRTDVTIAGVEWNCVKVYKIIPGK